MTVFIRKGDSPLTEKQIEKRTQAYIDRDWSQWKRERSIRKQDGLFNAYMDQVEIDTDVNRENNEFNHQLAAYTRAVARLEQYPLAEGRGPITEMQETGEYDEQTGEPITQEVVISEAVDPLEPAEVEETVFLTDSDGEDVLDSDGMPVTETVMVRNPILVHDEAERAEAESVIAETPQAVIDHHDTVINSTEDTTT